ncbi:MAG: hypothetical protein Q9168_002846, partial [Polycauliona sp. 1 TL-2023]
MATSISLFLSLLAASQVISYGTASSLKAVSLDFHVRRTQPSLPSIGKRETNTADLSRGAVGYYANLAVGTPPQNFVLHLDTGSSDTWIPSVDSNICQSTPAACHLSGSYDSHTSATGRVLQKPFYTTYADGSNHNGTFIADTVTFADATLPDMQLGLAQQSAGLVTDGVDTYAAGKIGLGFESMEAAVVFHNDTTYPNIVSELVNHGYIETKAYSLWLGSA